MSARPHALAVEPDGARLVARLAELAAIGRTETGACCRLALTDDDRRGRDLVVGWMHALGLQVSVTRSATSSDCARAVAQTSPR